ncbi:hypothetical protein GOP47_0008816 [Adiantum capillus-veneris]|uniref:Large ribosomal subunit protein uL15/eL18 domain-containing protein n=1 Tax=Adiantum capillus-veneris TaxID=13818 RepID=A0A9D4ZKR4_ADICA|nr:hypothetical protein GOP47_0008816 [Adiantum capillus-veneris]
MQRYQTCLSWSGLEHSFLPSLGAVAKAAMGITRARNKKTNRTSPRSDNVYRKLIVKLYRFLVQRIGSPFNAVFLNRLFMSRNCNMPPLSLSRLIRYMKGKEDEL